MMSLAFVALASWIFYSQQSADTRESTAVTTDTANTESNTEMALVSVPAPNLGESNCDMEYDKSVAAAGLTSKKVLIHGPIDEDFPGYGRAYRISPEPGTKVQKRSTVTYRSAWEES
jgi:hypothetical protein